MCACVNFIFFAQIPELETFPPKKQRVEIETEKQYPLETSEQFSIDSLELWKHTPAYFNNHAANLGLPVSEEYSEFLKLKVTQERIDSANAVGSNDTLTKAIIHTQRAFVEATQLVQLTAMLKAQQHIGLKTSFRSIKQDRGPSLPPLQVISILSSSFVTNAKTVQNVILQSLNVITQRRNTCNGLIELKRSWRLTYYDKVTGKEVSAKQYDPSKCLLAVNCNALPNQNVIPGGTDGCIIPLAVDDLGNFVVTENAKKMKQSTLLLSLLDGNGIMLGSVSLWSLIGLLDRDLRGNKASSVESDAMKAVNDFCSRRRHSVLCEILLKKLTSEVSQNASRWPSASSSFHHSSLASIEQILLHEPVSDNLSLVKIAVGSVQLRFTSSSIIRFSLCPIPIEGQTFIEDGYNPTEVQDRLHLSWLRSALHISLLQVLRKLTEFFDDQKSAVELPQTIGTPAKREYDGYVHWKTGFASSFSSSSSSSSSSKRTNQSSSAADQQKQQQWAQRAQQYLVAKAGLDTLRRCLHHYRIEQLVKDKNLHMTLHSEVPFCGQNIISSDFTYRLSPSCCAELLIELDLSDKHSGFVTVSFSQNKSAISSHLAVSRSWPRSKVSLGSLVELQMLLRKHIIGAVTRSHL